jgi:hypothetical protein
MQRSDKRKQKHLIDEFGKPYHLFNDGSKQYYYTSKDHIITCLVDNCSFNKEK